MKKKIKKFLIGESVVMQPSSHKILNRRIKKSKNWSSRGEKTKKVHTKMKKKILVE